MVKQGAGKMYRVQKVAAVTTGLPVVVVREWGAV